MEEKKKSDNGEHHFLVCRDEVMLVFVLQQVPSRFLLLAHRDNNVGGLQQQASCRCRPFLTQWHVIIIIKVVPVCHRSPKFCYNVVHHP
jgi:hypothetical protein